MKRTALFGFSCFLLGVTTLSGQTGPAHSDANRVVTTPNYSTSDAYNLSGTLCPVRVRALQGTGGGLVKVHGERPVEGPSQRIHLILQNPQSKTYASAKVVARGLSPKSHGLRTERTRLDDLTKTLDVAFVPEDAGSVSADLLLPGFTSVTSIELQSVTYQDGTTWSVADHQACRVAPDLLMLIAGP